MKLPAPQDVFLSEAFRIIERADSNNYKKNQDVEVGQNRVIVTSPNGTRFSIMVDNAGVLSTVAV